MLYPRPGKVQAIQKNKSKLEHNEDNFRRSFHWSLEPISRLMCFLGIPIPCQTNISTCRLASLLHSSISFLLVSLVQLYLLIYTFCNAKSISAAYLSGISTPTLSWNFIIENFTLALYTIGSHISFLKCTRSGAWSDLVNSLTLLDQNLASSDIYLASKQFAIKISIFVISSVLCVETLLLVEIIPNDSTLTRKILDGYGIFTKIYPATQLALFCILARIHLLQLEAIQKHVEELFTQSPPASSTVVEAQASRLRVLRRHHRLICNSIHKLSYCFGTFLALEVVFIFVIFIICALSTLMAAINGDVLLGVLSGVVCLDCIIHLFLLTHFSDDITKQINKVYNALAEILHQQPSLQNEITLFTDQLSHMKLDISAMGFFNVSKSLFPTLMGTTLTYFLLFLQFHSADKEES